MQKASRSARIQKKIFRFLVYSLLIAGSFVFIFPFYWLVRSAMMDMGQIFTLPPIWIPNPVHLENFVEPFKILPFGRYFLNTAIITLGTLLGTMLTASLSAYSFARMRWKGRDIVFNILLTSMMLPYVVTMIPQFIGWHTLGFTDSYAPLIVPAWFGGGTFNIFLLRQFFMTIPKELDEAATVDGAGHLRIFFTIILPLAKSALIVVGIFTFLRSWNDFLGPLIYINNDVKFTLALGLTQFKSVYTAQWHYLMATSTIVVILPIIIFFVGQKYIVEGITLTGMKA